MGQLIADSLKKPEKLLILLLYENLLLPLQGRHAPTPRKGEQRYEHAMERAGERSGQIMIR